METCYEVAVVPDADAEARRVTLTNRGSRPLTLEVTSYAEVALNPRRADQAHPAFAKLFLETEDLASSPALLCRRRPRARDQQPVWALHVLAGPATSAPAALERVECETDRARFLGRGRSAADPAAMESGAVLSGTVGPVLDPIFSLRRRVRVEPGASAVLAFTTAAPEDRDQALALAARFGSLEAVDRVFEEAAASEAARLAELGLTQDDAALFQRLAAPRPLCGPGPAVARGRHPQPPRPAGSVAARHLRRPADRAGANRGGPRPRTGAAGPPGARVLAPLRAGGGPGHSVRRGAGDDLRRRLEHLVQNGPTAELVDRPGGVFLRDASGMGADDITLLEAAARLILRGGEGPLAAQVGRAAASAARCRPRWPRRGARRQPVAGSPPPGGG